MMAFSEAQLKNLEAKLNSKYVKTRRVHDTTLAYVEGWHVIAEANRIFGYDAWDRHTFSTRCVWSGSTSSQYGCCLHRKGAHCCSGWCSNHHPRRLRQRSSEGIQPGRSA